MARASIALLAASCLGTALLVSAWTLGGCDSASETDSPDASPGPCPEGPFPFAPGANGSSGSTGALPQSDTTTPGCSSDDNANRPVIALLPHGTRYPVGETVNFDGTRDFANDCQLQTVCHCVIPDPSQVPTQTPVVDAGDDAEAGTTTTPPTTTTTPGSPTWVCQ